MKNFEKGNDRERNSGGFKRDFGKKQFGNRERPQMYDAVCSDCGKNCEVPFKPSSDKPIYCSRCFATRNGSDRSEGENRERPRFQEKRMFNTICDKCGKRFEISFKPTGDRPVYCNDCFDKGGSNRGSERNSNQYKEQFEELNAKLDKIIKLLTPVKKEKSDLIALEEEIVEKKKAKTRKPKKTIEKKSIGKKTVSKKKKEKK